MICYLFQIESDENETPRSSHNFICNLRKTLAEVRLALGETRQTIMEVRLTPWKTLVKVHFSSGSLFFSKAKAAKVRLSRFYQLSWKVSSTKTNSTPKWWGNKKIIYLPTYLCYVCLSHNILARAANCILFLIRDSK